MNKGKRVSPGIWSEMWRTLRLAWRLLGDPRVPLLVKILIPGLALFYTLLPIDVAPDLIPLLGQLDDLAALIIAARLLIEMSPPSVVAEHEFDLFESSSRRSQEPPSEDVIEADYRILE
ncbi:MAG TPA: DUF1232 domain-containing protein [Caldilineae bacterium]|nr:DUF1232 domain-containing protein [Caldilineae bacterium]